MNGLDFVHNLERFVGEPYRQDNPGRYTPDSGFKDCSGLIVAGLTLGGIHLPPGFDPVSTGLELWCRSVKTLDGRGLGRTVDEAYGSPGCLLFIWGYGDNGHVACSRGDGTTIETPAAGHKVGVRDRRNVWTGAALIPGIGYTVAPTPPPLDPAAFLKTLAAEVAFLRGAFASAHHHDFHYGDNGEGVKVIQLLLTIKGVYAGTVDGAFGPATLAAVQAFQHSHALVADGVVGPLTFKGLTG